MSFVIITQNDSLRFYVYLCLQNKSTIYSIPEENNTPSAQHLPNNYDLLRTEIS